MALNPCSPYRVAHSLIAMSVIALNCGFFSAEPTQYRVVLLPGLYPGAWDEARAVNEQGNVVGHSDFFPAIWEYDGSSWRVCTLSSAWAAGVCSLGSENVYGINSANQAVGVVGCYHINFLEYALLWSEPNADYEVISFNGVAFDINDAGVVAGAGSTSFEYGAYTWDDGLFTMLDPAGAAYAINNAGQVVGRSNVPGVGWAAAMWEQVDGRWVRSVVAPPDAEFSEAWDINERSEIVGYFRRDLQTSVNRAFLWRDGRAIDLGTAGARNSRAEGINDASQVVGWIDSGPSSTLRAFLWQDGVMHDLNDLIVADDPIAATPGFRLRSAFAIGNQGWIVGEASGDEVGLRAFVAIPVLPADLNADGLIDAADLAILLGSWGACPVRCPADFNDDGSVNAADLAQLLGTWLDR